MFQAFVLVRNVKSPAANFDFGEFTIQRVGVRFRALGDVFS